MAITPNQRNSIMPNAILEQVVSVLNETPNGANIILEWERPVETLKAHSDLNIRKHVRMVGRKGIDYDNMKAVIEKRENGELPSTNQGNWFVHDPDVKGLVRHKSKGTPYVQLFVGTSTKTHPESYFLLDGQKVELEEIAPFIKANEKKTEKGETFICKIENMIRIHREIGMEDISVEAQTSDAVTEQTEEA